MSLPSRPRTGSGPLVAILIIAALVAAGIGALAASGATPQAVWDSFFPVHNTAPATDRGDAAKQLYDIVFAIAVVIFLVVEAVIVYTVFRYRRKPGDDTLPAQTHGNNLVEVIWTAIPTAIVLFLFVVSWQTLNTVEAKAPESAGPTTIRVVASRFQFQFDYLDAAGETVFSQLLPSGEEGGMVVPVGEPVHVLLRSKDVIHAFYVPKFLFKRDVVPGKENTFDFTVDEPGTYRGQCAELCGTQHGAMLFEVRALPADQFQAWLAAAVQKAPAAPSAAPSGGPAASGAPGATGSALELDAKDTQFTQATLEAPAGAPFAIHYVNADAIPHDLRVTDASGAEVIRSALVMGSTDVTLDVPALAPGSYSYICTVHPTVMAGTLTIH